MDSELITVLGLRPFKWALICSICSICSTTGTWVMLVKVFFFGKGPGQGQIPGLLGHRSTISDRTIYHCKVTDLCWKFQLSRYYSGWEKGDRRTDRRTDGRTDDTTISVEPIFLINCSKKVWCASRARRKDKALKALLKSSFMQKISSSIHFWHFYKKLSGFFRKQLEKLSEFQ
jgi:hypothetical protein